MDDASSIAGDAGSRDPKVGLRAVAALRRLQDRLEALQVHNARSQGWSWEEIARELGVSKQAVHKKYGGGSLAERLAASLGELESALARRLRD